MHILTLFVILCIGMTTPILAQDDPTPSSTPSPEPTVMVTMPSETPSRAPTRGTPTATSTPRPDVPDYIYDWREELLYPVAVHFFLVIDRPLSAIQDIRLVMTVDDEAESRLIELAEISASATVTSPFTEINLIWQIPPTNPLPLNALVAYEWQVILSETETASVGGVFAYQHPQTMWTENRDPQNRLNFLTTDDIISASQLRNRLASIYDQMAQNTGNNPVFNFAIQEPQTRFDPCVTVDVITSQTGDNEATCNTEVLTTLLNRMNYQLVMNDFGLIDQLTRIMGDSFYAPLWANRDMPEWFRWGILSLYTLSDKQSALEAIKTASRTNTLFTLAQMNTADTTRLDLWRSQSVVMTLYMAQRLGLPALFELARSSDPFAQAYETAVGASAEALIPAVNNWIFTQQAQSASLVSLYTAPTPLPSETPSVTPFPPTMTNTPTNTATNTATATVTGVLSATPLPSLTPTITNTPRPATITPRPAGFIDPPPPLPTLPPIEVPPTPFPEIEGDIEATTDSGVLVTVILALAMVALAILFAIYWRTERKS